LQQFARGSMLTFTTLAQRDTALQNVLHQLPFVVGGNWAAVKSLIAAAPHVTPVLNTLADAVTKLKPSVKLLTPAAASGIKVVNALGGASPALKNVLASLDQLQPSATKALPAVHALLCQANPMIRFIQ